MKRDEVGGQCHVLIKMEWPSVINFWSNLLARQQLIGVDGEKQNVGLHNMIGRLHTYIELPLKDLKVLSKVGQQSDCILQMGKWRQKD